ncbi:unnamed protein product [Tetraodon nigroviridis]|uniref:(spotted green pufferfish) hypothetical protein n=1 Tax=Tetraodon nigroviridis TaxID=99883 RepID=Q4S575_TETNG|nr:unnamed protein product [Tetraodon nigroviridis]
MFLREDESTADQVRSRLLDQRHSLERHSHQWSWRKAESSSDLVPVRMHWKKRGMGSGPAAKIPSSASTPPEPTQPSEADPSVIYTRFTTRRREVYRAKGPASVMGSPSLHPISTCLLVLVLAMKPVITSQRDTEFLMEILTTGIRRSAPASAASVPDEELQRPVKAHRATGIQRTASASSVDLQDHPLSQRKNPVKTKGPMLKLVGSVTDLAVRRRQTPSPSPTSPSPMSPLSRLHDDYSRRALCLTSSERRQRPSPIRARVLSVGHVPLVHPQPTEDPSREQQEVFSPVFGDRSETDGSTSPGNSARNDSTTEAPPPEEECDSTTLSQKAPSQKQEPTDMTTLPLMESSDLQMKKALLEAEDVSPATSSTPEPPSPAEGAQTSSSETVSVKPRQRGGRQRPRPISDYGQLVSRTHSIPENAAEQHAKDRTADALLQKDCTGGFCESPENPSGSINGDVQNRRQRPLSMIGGVDVFPPSAAEKDERLSSVSF